MKKDDDNMIYFTSDLHLEHRGIISMQNRPFENVVGGNHMAIPTNIKTLLSGDVVEWARIEFKETWNAEASLKSVCAFANDLDNWGGGYIVIGVEENEGQPIYPLKGVPVDKIDAYQKNILSRCKLIRPAYMPIVEVVDYKDKKFIVLWCPGGDSRPYSSPKTMAKDNKERIHYIRKVSSTVEPSDDEEKDLFNLANRIPFDDRVNHQAEMSDLNITLIQNYLKEVKSSLYEKSKTGDFVEVCSNMNIISNLPEYTKPKNVGLMFFSMEPDKFFPYTQIDVVQFPDGLGGNNIIEQTFKGPIHQQLRDALQYISNTIITEKIVKHPERAEADHFFNYPFAAIEEALSNAVYHRAYDEREPIEVRVENDRIEILSFPGPDRSVTMEGLKSYRVSNRRYRNRRIGDFLKELHLTEGRNTGFKKILDALEANGSPKPEFETDEARSYFITRLFMHKGFNSVSKDEYPKEPKRSRKGAKKELKKGNERKQAIMKLLVANPTMTQTQLREHLNLTRKQIQTDMKELQEEGMLMRDGSNRKGRWIIISRN